MNDRLAKWDARYAAGDGRHAFAPSPPLPHALASVPAGHALDLAAGAGRHALYLAERGWTVVAVEGSTVGVGILREEAARRGLADRITARVVDLDAPTRGAVIEPDGYDLVCDFYFLDRSLFDAIRTGVRPGGLFVAAIHLEDPTAARAMNPAFLLAPGELRALIEGWGWEVLHAHEGPPRDSDHARATAEIVARRPG